ncbi:asparagine synthase C-terminal domain-containing protein [Nocardia sp. NBC_01327]|uniref:asparagine synthase C-terminal domain-containing protein n=1 Tax=Nocardia sp. NBC_01327 TaxID=2903593 RepID=UPI002E167C22|nr:asparagine synthase C-terminal domain-containing protein [Nocardia sp. NBC_01327]
MNTYPSVLLDIRSRRAGLQTRVGTAVEPTETGRLVIEEFGRGWSLPSGGIDSCSVIEWSVEQVVIRTSRLNPTTLYYWGAPGAGQYLIGTDRAELTARAITSVGVEVDQAAQIRRFRRAIHAIAGGRTLVLSRSAGSAGIEVAETVSQSWTPSPITGETAVEAGTRQIEALRREVIAAGTPRPVTAVVSGGVDSGLVAALAKHAGILDHLASLGTPWGDEYAAAEELGAHLSMPVRRIALSENEILRALPETVRMLGELNRETVAAGVNLVAVYQQGQLPKGIVLTGVGADLINSGHRVEVGPVDDLRSAVADRLAEAALTTELSGVAAAAHGYVLRHMYWNQTVIQAAIDTSPEVMRYRDREKGHMRAAAELLLPENIAWRRKQALHHGSGVDKNLDGAIARYIGRETVDVERFYCLIEAELVGALIAAPDEPIDSDKCLEAAVSAYTGENH